MEIFIDAVWYGLGLSLVLGAVMVISFWLAPDMWVGDYPPDIKAKYGEMSGRAKQYRPLIAVLFFGAILVVVSLALINLPAPVGADTGFWDYILTAFTVLFVFNLFDLLIADWLVFVFIQPKIIILPGTEGMAGYKDYGFHFRGFLIGIGFSLVGGLVLGAAGWGVRWLLGFLGIV